MGLRVGGNSTNNSSVLLAGVRTVLIRRVIQIPLIVLRFGLWVCGWDLGLMAWGYFILNIITTIINIMSTTSIIL